MKNNCLEMAQVTVLFHTSPPPLMIFISFGFIKTETGAKTTPLATKWVTKAAGDTI